MAMRKVAIKFVNVGEERGEITVDGWGGERWCEGGAELGEWRHWCLMLSVFSKTVSSALLNSRIWFDLFWIEFEMCVLWINYFILRTSVSVTLYWVEGAILNHLPTIHHQLLRTWLCALFFSGNVNWKIERIPWLHVLIQRKGAEKKSAHLINLMSYAESPVIYKTQTIVQAETTG